MVNPVDIPGRVRLRALSLISIDCVLDASLVPGTCLRRFLDLKGLINKFLESSIKGEVKKKHLCNGWPFPRFAAHVIEQDLF
jgi:hypothetical protein